MMLTQKGHLKLFLGVWIWMVLELSLLFAFIVFDVLNIYFNVYDIMMLHQFIHIIYCTNLCNISGLRRRVAEAHSHMLCERLLFVACMWKTHRSLCFSIVLSSCTVGIPGAQVG